MRGLSGVEAVSACDRPDLPVNQGLSVDNIDGGEAEFSCDTAAFIRNLPQLIDCLNWKTAAGSRFEINCGHIGSPVTVQSALAVMSQLNGYGMAVWGHEGKKYMALKIKDNVEPELWTGSGFDAVNNLAVRSYRAQEDFTKDRQAWIAEHNAVGAKISSDHLARRAAASIMNNVELSGAAYDSICRIADRILVEASEASRQGAGE